MDHLWLCNKCKHQLLRELSLEMIIYILLSPIAFIGFVSAAGVDAWGMEIELLLLVFRLLLAIISTVWGIKVPRGGRTWQKSTIRFSHHMRLVPHSTGLSSWIYYPFSLAKIASNFHKKNQITSPQPLLVVDLWKHPLYPRFHYAGTAGQKHP